MMSLKQISGIDGESRQNADLKKITMILERSGQIQNESEEERNNAVREIQVTYEEGLEELDQLIA